MRQSVALLRQVMLTGLSTSDAQVSLATRLRNMGVAFEVSETEAWLRESLLLCETTQDVLLQQSVLTNLANLSGRPGVSVDPAEAASLRARLNALTVQTGRSPETDWVKGNSRCWTRDTLTRRERVNP